MSVPRLNPSLIKSYLGREFFHPQGDTYNITYNNYGCGGSIWGGGFSFGYGCGCCCGSSLPFLAINAGLNLASLIFGRK